MEEKWITEAARVTAEELLKIARHMQQESAGGYSGYNDAEEIAGFSAVIEKHFLDSKLEHSGKGEKMEKIEDQKVTPEEHDFDFSLHHWKNWTMEQWTNAVWCPDCGMPMLEIEPIPGESAGHYQCVYCTWMDDQEVIENGMKRQIARLEHANGLNIYLKDENEKLKETLKECYFKLRSLGLTRTSDLANKVHHRLGALLAIEFDEWMKENNEGKLT